MMANEENVEGYFVSLISFCDSISEMNTPDRCRKKITKANNEMKIIFWVYDADDDDYYNGREA